MGADDRRGSSRPFQHIRAIHLDVARLPVPSSWSLIFQKPKPPSWIILSLLYFITAVGHHHAPPQFILSI
jgi:hypothetical protein